MGYGRDQKAAFGLKKENLNEPSASDVGLVPIWAGPVFRKSVVHSQATFPVPFGGPGLNAERGVALVG